MVRTKDKKEKYNISKNTTIKTQYETDHTIDSKNKIQIKPFEHCVLNYYLFFLFIYNLYQKKYNK